MTRDWSICPFLETCAMSEEKTRHCLKLYTYTNPVVTSQLLYQISFRFLHKWIRNVILGFVLWWLFLFLQNLTKIKEVSYKVYPILFAGLFWGILYVHTLDTFFRQIKSFRRFRLAFGFGLQTFYLINFS